MNRSTSVLGLIAVFAGTASVIFWLQLREERAVQAQSKVVTETREVKEPVQSMPVAQVSLPPETPALGQGSATIASVTDGNAAVSAERAKNAPQLRAHGMSMDQYPDLARELDLTSDEAEALAVLLNRQNIDRLMRSPPNVPPLTPEGMRALAELETKQQAELETRLGSKYRQWKVYQSTLEARRGVNEIRTILPSNFPLSDYQSAQLLSALTIESKRREEDDKYRVPATSDPRSQLELAEQKFRDRDASNRRLLESARSFLSAEQLASIENGIAQFMTRERSALQAQRERMNNPGR